MRPDLAVNELESAPGLCNLLAKTGGELGEQVAMLACSGLGVNVQLGNLAGEQRAPLCIERCDVAFCVLDLARDAMQLSRGAFSGNRCVDLAMIVEKTLQGLNIAAFICLVGAGHQEGEVLLLGIIACEVGMDALGKVAKESLQARWRVELLWLDGVVKSRVMALLRAASCLGGPLAGSIGFIEIQFALNNTRLQVIELGVEHAYLAEVAAFKCLELGAELRKLSFTLGQEAANGDKQLALFKESCVVRSLLKNDFSRHAASPICYSEFIGGRRGWAAGDCYFCSAIQSLIL